MKTMTDESYKGLQIMVEYAGALLCLLDRIEVEDNASLASQRFKMAEDLGLTVEVTNIEVGPAGRLH